VELLESWARDKGEPIWLDVTGGTQQEIEPLLEQRFGFHTLAAEDALSENALPKYDPFTGYDFLVFRAINLDVIEHGIESVKLACFLGGTFVFTVHPHLILAVDSVWSRLPYDPRLLQRGPDFLLYSILDLLVDQHFPILDQIEDRIDEIHNLIFAHPSPKLLDELLHLKRDLNVIRRYSIPQRELLNLVSRGDVQFIKREHLIYFRDVYDHLFRIGESIDVERDLATSTMDAYLSVIANRTNEIVKVLTIFSSILLPMNFIAGIYGMNFEYMPELHWRYGYLFAFLVMAGFATLMLFWFNRKGWLWPSRATVLHRERLIRKTLRRRGRPGLAPALSLRRAIAAETAAHPKAEPAEDRRHWFRQKRQSD
jgi:magnesium transporter